MLCPNAGSFLSGLPASAVGTLTATLRQSLMICIIGNIFVALQPLRGYGMDSNAMYHVPDLAPTHNYYALPGSASPLVRQGKALYTKADALEAVNGLCHRLLKGLQAQNFGSDTLVIGYDATSEVLEDWMYEQLTKTYLLGREMRDFLKQSNLRALKDMAGRLLEASKRGMWEKPGEGLLEALYAIYQDAEDGLELGGTAAIKPGQGLL